MFIIDLSYYHRIVWLLLFIDRRHLKKKWYNIPFETLNEINKMIFVCDWLRNLIFKIVLANIDSVHRE